MNRRRIIVMCFAWVLVVAVSASLLVGLAPARADTQAGVPRVFSETGHTLAYGFRQFYDTSGSLTIFGLPLTRVFLENGNPVQYFERARLEWHAEVPGVLVGHLGRWSAQSSREQGHAAFHPLAAPPPGAPPETVFFPETGHSLRGAFLAFWEAHGGLPVFGYPLSEEFSERNSVDGQNYPVQYFERARFEYHPELPAGSRVLLGHLGREYLAANPPPAWVMQPVAAPEQAWDAVRPAHLRIPRIGVDTGVVEGGFSYDEWDVPRYNAVHYWPVSGYPRTRGNIIIAGHVGYRGIIFNRLPEVQVGDEIYVLVQGEERRYRVQEVLRLLPHETWVMNPTPTETLTLITCIPIGVYSHRLVVRAVPAV
jgi:LPXTG-site transpeptidase (sortase) family protein